MCFQCSLYSSGFDFRGCEQAVSFFRIPEHLFVPDILLKEVAEIRASAYTCLLLSVVQKSSFHTAANGCFRESGIAGVRE